jgi:hypothetical protein
LTVIGPLPDYFNGIHNGKPFPHTTAWNLPDSFWGGEPNPPPGTPPEEEDGLLEAWDRELELHY